MNKIPAREIDGQRVVCKMLDWDEKDGPTDDRPDWLLECEGRLVMVAGRRVWVNFEHRFSGVIHQFLMSWRELGLREGA